MLDTAHEYAVVSIRITQLHVVEKDTVSGESDVLVSHIVVCAKCSDAHVGFDNSDGAVKIGGIGVGIEGELA